MPELTDSIDLRKRILQEASQYITADKQKDEFTVREFADINEIPITNGQGILYRMIEEGKITRRGEGRGKKIYYKFTKEPTE